ncbi:hypothetical protein BB560_007156, partial [Smittium megazygosporum]
MIILGPEQSAGAKKTITISSLLSNIYLAATYIDKVKSLSEENLKTIEETGQILYKLRKNIKSQLQPTDLDAILLGLEALKLVLFNTLKNNKVIFNSVSYDKGNNIVKVLYTLNTGCVGFSEQVVDLSNRHQAALLQGFYEVQALALEANKETKINWAKPVLDYLQKAVEILDLESIEFGSYRNERLKSISAILYNIAAKSYKSSHIFNQTFAEMSFEKVLEISNTNQIIKQIVYDNGKDLNIKGLQSSLRLFLELVQKDPRILKLKNMKVYKLSEYFGLQRQYEIHQTDSEFNSKEQLIKTLIDDTQSQYMNTNDANTSFMFKMARFSLDGYLNIANKERVDLSEAILRSFAETIKCGISSNSISETKLLVRDFENLSLEANSYVNISFQNTRIEILKLILHANKVDIDGLKKDVFGRIAELKCSLDECDRYKLLEELLILSDYFASRLELIPEFVTLELGHQISQEYDIEWEGSILYIQSLVKNGKTEQVNETISSIQKYSNFGEKSLEKALLLDTIKAIADIKKSNQYNPSYFEFLADISQDNFSASLNGESMFTLSFSYFLSRAYLIIGETEKSAFVALQGFKILSSLASHYQKKQTYTQNINSVEKVDLDDVFSSGMKIEETSTWDSVSVPGKYRIQSICFDLLLHLVEIYNIRGKKLDTEYFSKQFDELASILQTPKPLFYSAVISASFHARQHNKKECLEKLDSTGIKLEAFSKPLQNLERFEILDEIFDQRHFSLSDINIIFSLANICENL